MFQPSVAGSDELQYDHTVRKLASTILLLLCTSLSAQTRENLTYLSTKFQGKKPHIA